MNLRTQNRRQPKCQWTQWKHQSIGYSHCNTCLALDKCWFTSDNKPELPQHFGCHCTATPIAESYVLTYANATSDYRKYVPYLFNTTGAYTHRKEVMLARWGYTSEDAYWLQMEIERQAREKYILGDYSLGKLKSYGQIINIRVEIPRKDGGGTVSFVTGWMAKAYGQLTLNTPYGDD